MLNDTARVAGPFLGDGSTTALPFGFKVFADTDLSVRVTDLAGDQTIAVLDVDYTVTLNADQETDPGGTVTMTDPPATDYLTTIVSDLPLDQPLDLLTAGRFHAQRVEDAFDRVVMQMQQINDGLARTVRAPVGETLTVLPGATARANKVLVFNADGDASAVLVGDVGVAIEAVMNFEQEFTATAAQTLFTLTQFTYPVGSKAITVFMNGIRLRRSIDYVETSSSSFTLTTAADEGDLLVAFGSIAESSAPSPLTCIVRDLPDAAAGTGKSTFINPFSSAFAVTGVVASLKTAQTSGSIFTIDINEAGVSILSTKLTIDNGEKTSSTAATAAVISDASIAAYAEITIDTDQIGDGTAVGPVVYILGYPT